VAKKGHSEGQILRALRQADGGTRAADIYREHGISEATYYIWKTRCSVQGLSELREPRQLREEQMVFALSTRRVSGLMINALEHEPREWKRSATRAAVRLGDLAESRGRFG
jgi:putative transposase